MRQRYLWSRILWVITCTLCACTPLIPPTNTSGLQAVTAVPTLDNSDPEILCGTVEENWEQDWTTAIRALEALQALAVECFESPDTQARLYIAYLALGQGLEVGQRLEEAIDSYQSALGYDPAGTEAFDALVRLNVRSIPSPTICDNANKNNPPAAMYRATEGSFIGVAGADFVLNGQSFPVYGIDYYPRDTPWQRFLSETQVGNLGQEFNLLREAGLNTLRIALRHDLLFACEGKSGTAIPENIGRLDSIIQTAATFGFRLIMVLNDAPDLTDYPLYSNPNHSIEQMKYLAERYRDEPAILAWDIRDSGDFDYLSGRFERRTVLAWLAEAAILMRQSAPNHLVTASWVREIEATIPVVDFVSFNASENIHVMRQQIAMLVAATDKPITFNSIGYSTFGSSEEGQRDSLQMALDTARNNGLAGWSVWTAFDFPLTVTCYQEGCVNQDSFDHHYGLWTTDYMPKLAIGVIQIASGLKGISD